MQNKFEQLKIYLSDLEKQGLYLAFSGGIDSTLLLWLCKDLDVTAVTFKSAFQPKEEIAQTRIICKNYGIKQKIIEYFPLSDNQLKNNPKDRCYYCKKLIFSKLKDYADGRNIIDGTNYDDLSVYRPGIKALKELGIISPFAKFEITKKEIRDYAKECGINIFDKPSTPCLATRFPYGARLSEQKLLIVEQGEKILHDAGFDSCRLRIHEDIARIEIPQDNFADFINARENIIQKLKPLGFMYITLDMEGLRSGSMDIPQ